MIRTLVIDDEPLALQQLAAYVGKIPYLTLVGECQSALEARDIIAREQIDAIFIDINMPIVRNRYQTPETSTLLKNSWLAVTGRVWDR